MKIEEVKQLLEKDKETVTDLNSLNELKVKYLGKKGMLTELNQEIKNIPNEGKKEFGQKVNEVRNNFTNFYEEKKSEEVLEQNAADEKAMCVRKKYGDTWLFYIQDLYDSSSI